MAEGYCWVCDRPVDIDPCPTCGTAQYEGAEATRTERLADEVLDTSPAIRPRVGARSPVVIGLVVLVAIVVMVLVFQAGAGIS